MKCKWRYTILLVLPIVSLFSACKSVEKVTGVKAEAKGMSEIVSNKINISNYPEHYLMENGDLVVKGNNRSNAKITIYVKKDEQIFASIKFMGFEIMRAQISKDSVKYINRINREYLFSSFDEFVLKNIFPGNFNTLQNFIITGIYFNEDQNKNELIRKFIKKDSTYWFTNVSEEGRKIEMIYSADNIKISKFYYSDYILDILSEFDIEREGNDLRLIEGQVLSENLNLELELYMRKVIHEPYFKTDFTLGKNYKEIGFKF